MIEQFPSKQLKNPLIPMWSITGNPSFERLRKELKTYREQGIEQILIYPRTGLEVPYLSSRWFEIVRCVVEDAARGDMSVWLYDELNWPSGNCGGQIEEESPELVSKIITAEADGDSLKWTVASVPQLVDMLNPATTKRFIEKVHEQYKSAIGEYFGSVVSGIFTDEPSFAMMYLRGHVLKDRVFGDDRTHCVVTLPWFNGLEEQYKCVEGVSFREDVQRAWKAGELDRVGVHYWNLVGRRFVEAFWKPIRQWCDEHDLYFSGHLYEESTPITAVRTHGDPLSCSAHLSLPGIDEIHTQTRFDNAEWLTHKTLQRNRKHADGGLAELFALGPCDMPMSKMRQMMAFTAMHGVDHFVLALARLDQRGNLIKGAYYNEFSPAQPWFEHLSELGEEARELISVARKIDFAAETPAVYVRFPRNAAVARLGTNPTTAAIGEGWGLHIGPLMGGLCAAQWPVRLLAENEPAPENAIALVEYDDGDWTIRIGDKEVFRAQDEPDPVDLPQRLAAALDQHADRPFEIRTSDGSLATDVYFQPTSDQQWMILNLSGKDKLDLTAKTAKGESWTFDLYSRSWCVLSQGDAAKATTLESVEIVEQTFDIELKNANTLRPHFVHGSDLATLRYVMQVKTPLENIRIHIRNTSHQVVTLDNETLNADQPCEDLPSGFADLYRSTKPLSLSSGTHVLRVMSDFNDSNFFPSLLITGAFGAMPEYGTGVLKTLLDSVGVGDLRSEGLKHFIGKLTLETSLKIPAPSKNHAIALKLNVGEQIVQPELDGQPLGLRAWNPYVWEIPPEFQDRQCKCKLTFTTSIGGMFGDGPSGPPLENVRNFPGEHAALGSLGPIELIAIDH